MIKVYRKTATIKAEQFDGSDEMVKKYNITPPMPLDPDYTINTLEGDMALGVGGWVATGIKGEHWPIASDVFKNTYAELPVIPKVVGEILRSAHGQTNLFSVFETANNGYKISETLEWIYSNQNTFARAWLDGHQTEGNKI